jgi:adenylate cyclase
MAIDERSTLAALDVGRQIFSEATGMYDGRIVDTAGDSVLAVFNSMLGALTAALEIQQRMDLAIVDHSGSRRMRFRIGVHLGDVLEKPDGSVYGLNVNLAARVQELAEPGGVAVSEAVCCCAQSRRTFGFVDQGAHHLKNIDTPVRVYRLSSAIDQG